MSVTFHRVCVIVLMLVGGALNLRSQEAVSNATTPGNILNLPIQGEFKVLFLRVDYPDASAILSDTVAKNFAGTFVDAIDRNSYGKVHADITITPVLRMPNSTTYYQGVSALPRIRADAVRIARQNGFPAEDFDREIVFSQQIWTASVGRGGMNWRTVLIGCDSCPYTPVHELGHTFGWAHANFWEVSEENPISSTGISREYGDRFDIMGGTGGPRPHTSNPFHHFNPWFKQRVGWIPDQNILTVTQSGTYTIQAIEDPPQAPPVTKYTALRIRKDAEKDYWVFYRSEEEYVSYGPVITWGYHSNMEQTDLLDMNPLSQEDDWKDAALGFGQIFTDNEDDISIRVVARNSDEVVVEVSVPSTTVDNVPVIDVVRPAKGQTILGDFEYEVTAYDPDVGSNNGNGIERVELALIGEFRDGAPPDTFAQTVEFSPPYAWNVDLATLTDDHYFLLVKAFSEQGGENTVWFPHFVDNMFVQAPDLVFPGNAVVDVPTDVTLRWKSVLGADSYRVQVGTSVSPPVIVFEESGLTDTTVAVTGLDNNTTYFWRVSASNEVTTSGFSPIWQFKTKPVDPPPAPLLSSPPDEATGIDRNPKLAWNSVTEANSYALQVSTQLDFGALVVTETGLTDTSYQVAANLAHDTQHFWRVRGNNVGGPGDWSSIWAFRTIMAPPAAPVLNAPQDGATDVPVNVTLSWDEGMDAASYRLQVATQSDFGTTVVDTDGITATSYQIDNLEGERQHFWRVRANNEGGTSDWSPAWSFQTEAVSSVEEISGEIPEDFFLAQNYPNPFNPTTTLRFELPKAEFVTLKIYSILGEEVATLAAKRFQAGKYEITFDASRLSSGTYLFRLQSSSFSQTRKMLLIK